MFVRWLMIALVALGASSGDALAWAYKGHKVTGSIADQLLGENAKTQLKAILGFDLRTAGPWADCARSVARLPDGTFKYAPSNPDFRIPCTAFETPAEIARMEDYVSRNWHNCVYQARHGCDEAYHFTDVAIQHDQYGQKFFGASEHDVVGAINAAILVLKDRRAPLPFSIRDKKEALLLLAHFLGDLHQPLHVGAVYLDTQGQQVNPDQAGTLDPETETAGGNLINDQGQNLHSEWDAIPSDIGESAGPELLAKARAIAPTSGQPEDFAVIWATDTLRVAQSAFAGMTFTFNKRERTKWDVTFADRTAYWNEQDRVKRDQLAKGGARLAQLLNTIWPTAAGPVPPVEKVTACTLTKVCYCVAKDNLDAIAANVARIRQLIADQRVAGKAIGYLSIPLSTLGGGYFGVNQEVAAQTKDRIERRFGAASVWILNPGAEGNLPPSASGEDFMYMWTQILEGRGGYGEDFDFFYFTGPSDFARFFDLTGTGDADRIATYFDRRLASDFGLKSAVEANKISRIGFRNYYALRASVSFSRGSHDEWNISHSLNERRRGSDEFGTGNQISIWFDGAEVAPGLFEGTIAGGYVGTCK